MKSLNFPEVVADIDVRMILFDKIRIVKNNVGIDVTLNETKETEIVNKNYTNEVNDVKKIVDSEILSEYKNNEIVIKENTIENEIVNKNSNLIIVTDELINQDNFVKKDFSEIDLKKLAEFKKNDDYFFGEVVKEVEVPKKEKSNIFKTISGFFTDKTKDSFVDETKASFIDEELDSEIILNSEKNEFTEDILPMLSEPEIDQTAIDNEKAIKAEKLRLIEEEYRLKAEKREADEKLLLETQENETFKNNADFRKNKRKK